VSYTVEAFIPSPDLDLLEAARAAFKAVCGAGDPGPIDEEAEARKRCIVDALLAAEANLKSFQVDAGAAALDRGITVDEARRLHRHVFVSGRGPLNGVRFTVHDAGVSATLSYLDATPEAVKRAWPLFAVLERVGGYRVYDPQLDRVLRLDRDCEAAERRFAASAGKLGRLTLLGDLLTGKLPRRRKRN
jgi:hypothetical protein